jgi:predicted HAD superfamily Cof-like phosphohydrolase
MRKVGQVTPPYPQVPDPLTRVLRVSLLLEEVLEFAEASGIQITLKSDQGVLSIDDINYNIIGEPDLVKVADGLGDINYVSAGGACSYGIDMEPIDLEICRSNDSKLIDGKKREDGKWIKGPSYSPVNLEPLLEKQMPQKKVGEEHQLNFDDKLNAI